jgi:hypothetical protein
MNSVLVWILITVGGYNGNTVTYSPPMTDLATCEFLKKSVTENTERNVRPRCVQIKMVTTK